MATIRVELGTDSSTSRNYDIEIAPGILDTLGDRLATLGLDRKSRKVLLASHPAIDKHYGDRVRASLQRAGFDVATILIPAGERYKNATSLHKIYDAAFAHRLERHSTLVALGGGVIGDMAGFAAATWLRGIPFVQVPTSLLAMVDAAIGGKTGIDHPGGKNLIGAFHQPRLVWIDPDVLQTLPPREFRAAMAEVIKYGVIWDRELFELLERCDRLDRLRDLQGDLLLEVLRRCAQAKAEVVSKDEKEGNLRAILNFGHTIGHAIETVTRYRLFNHGEAVAVGSIAAGAIAVDRGFWQATEQERLHALVRKAKLPDRIPADVSIAAIQEATTADKKVSGGTVRFVLPTAIGRATSGEAIDGDTVRKILQQILTP